MRIIAIGIGGAGCRIVNSLYAIDRKSSQVACVQGLAIDVDEETIKQLTGLPDYSRMCFSALDTGIPDSTGTERQTASIDINEIVSRVQNMESGENDAIIFCCGLGGSMVDVAPHVIAGLRSSVVEPIFGLVTLPCLAEGERISAKAADDVEMLSSLLDGIIVFDNETWHKKIKTQKVRRPAKERGFAERIGLIKSEQPLTAAQETYHNLNEVIVRRIGLILRAGEFKADGGIDLAEVVLDSGEVLNTMKGMGFITIGYAVEKLPHNPLSFLSWFKPAGIFDEEQKKKASRIIELAKQAIYHEISTPCDLTSAHKALVLIAGPSQELSMKGFMTVRKWIDRSIAGLETRSGDYPVVSTKNVAIIVMLSGLENIPRITELNEIRSQSKPKKQPDSDVSPEGLPEKDRRLIRDDMITLPKRKSINADTEKSPSNYDKPEIIGTFIPVNQPGLQVGGPSENDDPVPPVTFRDPVQPASRRPVVMVESGSEGEPRIIPEALAPSRRRIIVARAEKDQTCHLSPDTLSTDGGQSKRNKTDVFGRSVAGPPVRFPDEMIPRAKETDRQRIERELRRQRAVAVGGGDAQKVSSHTEKIHQPGREIPLIQRSAHKDRTDGENKTPVQGSNPAELSEKKRTVIIAKRKIITKPLEEDPDPSAAKEKTGSAYPDEALSFSEDAGLNVEIREQDFQARDEIFKGKGVRKPSLPQARDSTLLHTELRPRKRAPDQQDGDDGDTRTGQAGKDKTSAKKRTRSEEKNLDRS